MPQLAIRPYFNFGNNNLPSNIMDNTDFNIPYSSMNQDNNNNNDNNINNNNAPRQIENDLNNIISHPMRPKRHVSSSNNINDLNYNKKRIAKNYDFINNNNTHNYHNNSNDNYNTTNLTNHNTNINNIHTNVSPYKRISIYSELNSTNKSNVASPKDASRRASINKNSIDTPQPSLRLSDQAHSPFYVSNNSFPNLNNRNMKNITSGVKINEMNINHQPENHPFENHTFLTIKELTNTKSTFIDNSTEHKNIQTGPTELSNNTTTTTTNTTNNNSNIPTQQDNMNQHANNNNNNNNLNDNGNSSEAYNNNNSNNNGDNGNNNNNNNNNSNNNMSNNKRSSQALVQKLQEIYKVIVKQEIELQERCSQLTTSQTTELKNLWTIYRINIDLINNYITFITTALLPSQSPQDILIGEEIVEIYRIERRLWVYGTITFLDVLKNFSNFMDPEVCAQFITHVFISLSSILIDIPPKHAIPWLQRLGDLSRMAIALYPSGFIDWKLSAEHWYMEAMRFTYSHGKLYYHMSTVQQNTLEAFVNLGKSVFCQDTFTPSQQYMQLVIDNIYQRTFVERSSTGNYRNADLIDYLKHSEVMLLPSFLGSNDLQQVVLNYFQDRFGIDFNDNNIFNTNNIFCQPPASLRFFFRHAPAFAESHILQLVGFGNPKNPFALLFDLPKFLKERKDKKDKNKSKSSSNGDVSTGSTTTLATAGTDGNNNDADNFNSPSTNLSGMSYLDNVDSLKYPIEDPDICTWIKSLDYINMTSLKCSMIVLKKFLHAPFVITLPHLLPWTYFIIASGLKIKNLQDEKSYKFWRILLKRIFPWNTITSFLNVLLAYVLDNFYESRLIEELSTQYSQMSLEELLEHFNENEDLPEVWKCWGTLWFDVISDKYSINADTLKGYGIDDHMFLDFPIDGIGFDPNDESGEKFWRRAIRVIFLFKGIADNFEFGLKANFKTPVYCNRDDINENQILRQFSFKLEPYNEPTSSKFNEFIPLCEEVNEINSDLDAVPELSIIAGENIFEYTGYHRLSPDINSYDKNGEFVGSSIYTSWMSDQMQPPSANSTGKPMNADIDLTSNSMIGNNPANNVVNDFNLNSTVNNNIDNTNNNINSNGVKDVKLNTLINEMNENDLFKSYMNSKTSNIFMNKTTGEQHRVNNIWKTPYDEVNRELTYFVFDATSWLRHFAHIYKLATNEILKFGVCLTTFQELRFLRKSKDENVVEAASRAIITMRQLYSEGKLLPLRFTGNVATDIEEHLEFEEQITWRSHVDEFVIEAVMKAQEKFTLNRGAVVNTTTTNNNNNGNVTGAFNSSSSPASDKNMRSMNPLDHSYSGNNSAISILNSETSPSMATGSMDTDEDNVTTSNGANDNGNNTRFQYIVLVTNDQNMKRKAQDQNIKTFSTDFIFSICSKLGMDLNVCTN